MNHSSIYQNKGCTVPIRIYEFPTESILSPKLSSSPIPHSKCNLFISKQVSLKQIAKKNQYQRSYSSKIFNEKSQILSNNCTFMDLGIEEQKSYMPNISICTKARIEKKKYKMFEESFLVSLSTEGTLKTNSVFTQSALVKRPAKVRNTNHFNAKKDWMFFHTSTLEKPQNKIFISKSSKLVKVNEKITRKKTLKAWIPQTIEQKP